MHAFVCCVKCHCEFHVVDSVSHGKVYYVMFDCVFFRFWYVMCEVHAVGSHEPIESVVSSMMLLCVLLFVTLSVVCRAIP